MFYTDRSLKSVILNPNQDSNKEKYTSSFFFKMVLGTTLVLLVLAVTGIVSFLSFAALTINYTACFFFMAKAMTAYDDENPNNMPSDAQKRTLYKAVILFSILSITPCIFILAHTLYMPFPYILIALFAWTAISTVLHFKPNCPTEHSSDWYVFIHTKIFSTHFNLPNICMRARISTPPHAHPRGARDLPRAVDPDHGAPPQIIQGQIVPDSPHNGAR